MLVSGSNDPIEFAIVHDPVRPPEEQNENYAHCELSKISLTYRLL